jgi:hypothetical protein
MMKGTDLLPDHVVAKLILPMGKATVRKITVNAVMAGALPTHMPLLIAAVQALSFNKGLVNHCDEVAIVNAVVRHLLGKENAHNVFLRIDYEMRGRRAGPAELPL